MLIEAVRRARLLGVDGLVDLILDEGRIIDVSPSRPGPGLDVDGRAVLPGLVDAHVHLDKAFHLEAIEAVEGAVSCVQDAMAVTADLQRAGGLAPAEHGAERLLEAMVRGGTTAARIHVELSTSTGIDPVLWHRELADAWADRIHLQLVAFPQLGLLADAGLPALLEEALDRGCTVVGACPYADADQPRHIAEVFEIADRRGAALDLHLDFTGDPTVHHVDDVIRETAARGWRGRVTVGHVTSLGTMEPAAMAARARALADAGVSVVSLPATDHFLAGGMAPLGELLTAGVNVAVATNNVQNAFTPYGRGELLPIAWFAGLVGRLGPGRPQRLLLDTVTTNPAAVLGLDGYGVRAGCRADLIVLDTDRPIDAVVGPGRVQAALRGGRLSWDPTFD